MKNMVQISLMLWLLASAAAQAQPAQPEEKALRVYDWKEVKLQPQPPGSDVFSTNGISVLKIENTNNASLEATLLTITNASLIAKADSISCEMKYENVLERLIGHTNRFGSFQTGVSGSLTLSCQIPPLVSGGDARTNASNYDIGGTSNWKPYDFSCVGVRAPGEGFPTQLELKLSLPTNGTVYLRPIKLWGIAGNSNWWSPERAGLIGGIGGGLIGCFGGLLGWLASKGKGRNFVLATMKIFIALGILLTLAGLVAVVSNQPYAVWYALLLPGVILTLVFSLKLPSIQRRYDELEIRRMTSVDV